MHSSSKQKLLTVLTISCMNGLTIKMYHDNLTSVQLPKLSTQQYVNTFYNFWSRKWVIELLRSNQDVTKIWMILQRHFYQCNLIITENLFSMLIHVRYFEWCLQQLIGFTWFGFYLGIILEVSTHTFFIFWWQWKLKKEGWVYLTMKF